MGIAVEHAEKPAWELAAKKFLTELGLGSGLGYRETGDILGSELGLPSTLPFRSQLWACH